jgi:transposase
VAIALEQLSGWLLQAEQIPELKSFVGGIERDRSAAEAALRLQRSQGSVEGNVNRLKTLKRQMYGKAGFALLRQRVLRSSHFEAHAEAILRRIHQKPIRANFTSLLTEMG